MAHGSAFAQQRPQLSTAAAGVARATLHEQAGANLLRRSLACALFGRLRDEGIRVAVLNGLDTGTGCLGRDLDVMIHRRDLPVIVRRGQEAAAHHGWDWTSSRWPGMWLPCGLCQLVFHCEHDGRIINLALDLICSEGLVAGAVRAYGNDLLDTPPEWIDGIPFSHAGHYLKAGLVNVLAGVEKGFATVEQYPKVPPRARQSISTALGSSFLAEYEAAIRDGSLRRSWPTLRRRAQWSALFRNTPAVLRNVAYSALRRLVGSRLDHVVTVAIVGPDGVGKSAAIAACRARLSGAFVDVRYRHWRPCVLPPLKALAGGGRNLNEVGPEGVPPRRHPGRLAFARRVYYAADYLIGYWLRDRHSRSSEIPLNLYDRCALDMHVDPLRFGLPASRSNLFAHRLSRNPDRVIVLRDAPERIAGRKQELSTDEIGRQIAEWESLHRQKCVQQIIDVEGKSADEVGAEIASAILSLLSRMQVAGSAATAQSGAAS